MGHTEELELGRLYLLRGGHIVRYVGSSAGFGNAEVLRPLTRADARLLRLRYVNLMVRRLRADAAWVLSVMSELGIEPPRIPKQHQPWRRLT